MSATAIVVMIEMIVVSVVENGRIGVTVLIKAMIIIWIGQGKMTVDHKRIGLTVRIP